MKAAQNDILPVLIAGGGPVGLSLAADLGWRGIRCLLVEQGDGMVVEAKMFAPGIRTLEFCRRWGIATKVRDWGFPRDFPFDNVFVTSLVGHELGRMPRPSFADTQPSMVSPEHYAHCPQFVFDPVLAECARSFPAVTLRYHCRLTGFCQDADGVSAELLDQTTGRRERVRASYLVGCDGYHSAVREALGIAMRGKPFINRSINVMFRTADLTALHDKGRAGRYVIVGPKGPWASLTAADGHERWRIMLTGTEDFDLDAIAVADIIRRSVGRDFPFEVLTVGHWTRRMMVADHYGRGRVFLAGDAVHVMPPNGGLGMNTGIGDAVDLGWKLAAVVEGWGGRRLLDSYEVERRPVGVRAGSEAMRNFARLSVSGIRFDGIFDETSEGARRRAELGRRLATSNRAAWDDPDHTHLGYRYDTSPLCLPDGTSPPVEPEDRRLYTQTSRPGARAPHAWLRDGHSTLDLFGRGFVLLRLGPAAPAADTLRAAAGARAVPLAVVDIADGRIAELYERRLALVRPDGHVAWRGDTLPEAPLAFIDRVRGAAPPAA